MIDRDLLPDGAAVGADRIRQRAPRKSMASAGFGSPGEDTTVRRIDLNDALIRHPQATFVMRAAGHTMADACIADGDVLLVDRAIAPVHGHVVIATVVGELVCRPCIEAAAARVRTRHLRAMRPSSSHHRDQVALTDATPCFTGICRHPTIRKQRSRLFFGLLHSWEKPWCFTLAV